MTSREKRFASDVQNHILVAWKFCKWNVDSPIKNVEYNEKEKSVTFMVGKTHVTVSASEDYPENTFLSIVNPAQKRISRVTNDPIQVLVDKIVKEFLTADSGAGPVGDVNSNLKQKAGVERLTSVDSHHTEYSTGSDGYSDCEDFDDDYYNEQDDGGEEGTSMHPLLEGDMERVKEMFGEASLNYRLFGTIDDIDVELLVPMTSFLDEEIAKAWKIRLSEPIIVRLHLSVSRYLDASEPKIEVFQPSRKEKFGVGSQMRKILENFLQETWKHTSNDQVQTLVNAGSGVSQSKKGGAAHAAKPTPPPRQLSGSQDLHSAARPVDEYGLVTLMDVGFSEEMSRNALIITRGDLQLALDHLVSNPDVPDLSSQVESVYQVGPPRPPKLPPRRQKSQTGTKTRKATPPLPGTMDSAATGFSLKQFLGFGKGSDDLLPLLPGANRSETDAKSVPPLDCGFLVQVMNYVRQRLPTLSEFCVVCDEPHVFQNGAMLKPSVCARELCVFAFQTLGVMSDAAEDIATGAEVVDLLISMANSACRSNRRDLIFDPYPTIVDPSNPCELALNPKKKDYKRVISALDNFLDMNNMTTLVGAQLKRDLDKRDPYSYPLLQWIITSNRSHIVKLPQGKQLSFMRTPHQFLLLSSPPAKEAIFREAKKQHGSTFAFHGSHIENWHSILRHGLINASGSKLQMHGAAYGNGIYLSPHSSVSFGYSGMGYSRQQTINKGRASGSTVTQALPIKKTRFLESRNLTCVALCEVITTNELKKNGQIWVMPTADHVCTRFFFVYEDGQVGESDIDTQADKYRLSIQLALGYRT